MSIYRGFIAKEDTMELINSTVNIICLNMQFVEYIKYYVVHLIECLILYLLIWIITKGNKHADIML